MYQALYRKYRPKTFSEVVGQQHITDTLQRQVADGQVGHEMCIRDSGHHILAHHGHGNLIGEAAHPLPLLDVVPQDVYKRQPLGPTHAPMASRLGSSDHTAIFVRLPASRAMDRTSTVPS